MTFIIQGSNMLAVICSTNKPWENLIRIDTYLTLQQTVRYRLVKVISSRGFRMIKSAIVLGN
ncbi:MAG: hypothetical protein KJO20_05745 [Eudoraea sp.]|nr:hypothetical protein [Eudoraea sp.]